MTTLVIVESPSKAKHVQHILGNGYLVTASMGHVRDMPVREMGIAPPDFAITYEATDKGKSTLSKIRPMVQRSDSILLATDPDREGEAIAWHLKEALRLPANKTMRITYNEVTEAAVKAAIKKPRAINMDLVRAQEGRRGLDRLVGYTLSGKVSDAVGQPRMSAGRVQSPIVRLIVEREDLIGAHNKIKHYGARLSFPEDFTAEWVTDAWRKPGEQHILDRSIAELAAATREVEVIKQDKTRGKRNAPPPLITTTLLQAANKKLSFSSDHTMSLAQKLFEGSHITYHRTDSVHLDPSAVSEIRRWATQRGLPVPDKPNQHKSKSKNAQEAHEAIRPTDVNNTAPAGLSKDEQALYALIHTQAVASQLAAHETETTKLDLRSTDHDGEKPYDFQTSATRTLKPGFTKLTGTPEDTTLPSFSKGDVLTAVDGEVLEKETKPPARFTEATLLSELDKRGIGRPSTWASILKNIFSRNYIKMEKKQIRPTPLGVALVRSIVDTKFAAYDYTAAMEEALDAIARGEANYVEVMAASYAEIQRDAGRIKSVKVPGLPSAGSGASKGGTTKRKAPPEKGAPKCPQCGSPMIRRRSSYGEFWGCSSYPECKATINIEDKGGSAKKKGGRK